MFRYSSGHLQGLLHQTNTYKTPISKLIKTFVVKIVGVIKYRVGARAELVCSVNITAYTPLPDNSHNR